MARRRQLIAPALGVALALEPVAFAAAPEQDASEQDPVPDPAVNQAARLFDDGQLRYQTSDYVGAVESFTEAYRQASNIVDEVQRDKAMVLLLFNLAQAHSKAYEVDKDATHLRVAHDLLDRYLSEEDEPIDEMDAENLRREIEAKLAAREQTNPGLDPVPATTPEAGPTPAAPEQDHPRPNGLVIGGAVVAGLAGPALGLMAGGLVMGRNATDAFVEGPTRDDRESALSKGRTGNVLAIGGGVGAAVLAATGVALIVVGKRRGRQEQARLWPAPGPGVVGVGLGGGF